MHSSWSTHPELLTVINLASSLTSPSPRSTGSRNASAPVCFVQLEVRKLQLQGSLLPRGKNKSFLTVLSFFPRHHEYRVPVTPRIQQNHWLPPPISDLSIRIKASQTRRKRCQSYSRAGAKMCRSTDFQGSSYFNDQHRLKVKSFFVRLSNLHGKKQLPESLTLVYLPRINETALEISGKNVRPDSPAFVALHRNITAKTSSGEAIYGSRERVVASEGVTFEVYLREEKVLKGIFRRDDEEGWKLECKSALERKINPVDHDVAVADVCVGVEGNVVMIERVEMVVKRKRNGRRCGSKGLGLELAEIPEEREVDIDGYESDGCRYCSCGEEEIESDGGDLEEMNIEGSVSWAVDVGIWVMCLGVGYLVSKASAKSLRRKRIF